MKTAATLAFALALPAVLAGCGAPQNCDPRAGGNIFQVAGCVMHKDGYQARIDRLSQEASLADQELRDAQQDRRSADARRDSAASRAAGLRAELATQRTRSIRLERDIQTARQQGRMDEQRLSQLEQDLTALRAEQDRLRTAPANPQQQQQLQDLRRRQESLEQQWDRLRTVAPRS
jgi:chromosome segregation ATPase